MNHGGPELAAAVRNAYAQGQADYTMEPLTRADGRGRVRDGDSVIFCCRRGEREIELTELFTDPAFDRVPRTFLPDLSFSILTLYHEKFASLPVAFAPARLSGCLAEVLSAAGRTQFHLAESEKYAHVTFFFNGGNNAPFPGEKDIRVPSPKGVPFDTVPALSLPQVVAEAQAALGSYDFGVVNFANGDVIGHTANREAKLRAAEAVSAQLKALVTDALAKDYVVLITADHGNIETLYTEGGKPHVAHTSNLVPFLALDAQGEAPLQPRDGALCDVAPTVLQLMQVPQPAVMTGTPLLAPLPGKPRRVLLLILDGWGLGTGDDGDAIALAHTPYWDQLLRSQPSSRLRASGEAVGLCAGKTGNSEAGHLNLGAGRVVDQDDVRLDKAIADGSFAINPVFVNAAERAKAKGAALHLIAYLSHASSHGSIDYPLAIAGMAKEKGLAEVYFHIILDGRSTPPGSAPDLLAELEEKLEALGVGFITGCVGRGLALDRDGNYSKVKRAYDAMVDGIGIFYN